METKLDPIVIHDTIKAFCAALMHRDAWSTRLHCTDAAWEHSKQLGAKALLRKVKRHGYRFNCGTQVHQEGARSWILIYGYSGSADTAFYLYALLTCEGTTAKVSGITDSESHANNFLTGQLKPLIHLEQLTDNADLRQWAQQQARHIADSVLTSSNELNANADWSSLPDFGANYDPFVSLNQTHTAAHQPLIDVLKASKSKLFVFTSATAGEGKSTTAYALGRLLADAELKTLLIDADLRNPMLTRSVEAPETDYGFSDWAGSELAHEECTSSPYPGLQFMTAGTTISDPDLLYSYPKLHERLSKLFEDYDRVLIDAAPCLRHQDALKLLGADSALTDIYRQQISSIFLIDYASVPKIVVQAAVEKLRASELPISHFVLNRSNTDNKETQLEVLIERCWLIEEAGRAAIEFRVKRARSGAGQTHWLVLKTDEEQQYIPVGTTETLNLERFLQIHQQGPWARFD